MARPATDHRTVLIRPRAEFEQKIRERIRLGVKLQERSRETFDEVEPYLVEAAKWRDFNLTFLDQSFSSRRLWSRYHTAAIDLFVGAPTDQMFEQSQKVYRNVGQQITQLESILDEIGLFDVASAAPIVGSSKEMDRTNVFVVHGRDTAPRDAVARVLGQFGITPIILTEQANRGGTVIEKVEANNKVGFAVVLLTPDDEGCLKGENLHPRARQNVMLELGYFIGLLGRKYVCAFNCGGVEIPSDFAGVIAEAFDAGGGWKMRLAIELKAAGFNIDLNKLLPS